MIEDWIDTLCNIWAVSAGEKGTVRSYHFYDRAEFPSAPTSTPFAVTVPDMVRPEYSMGGPLKDHWRGHTEFYLTDSVDRSLIPYCVKFIARIRNAAAANAQLGGSVDRFYLRQDIPDTIRFARLKWNENTPEQFGIIVQWEVKDAEEGQFTVSK